jgi:hypothetical protein
MYTVTHPKAVAFANSIRIPVKREPVALELYGHAPLIVDEEQVLALMLQEDLRYYSIKEVQETVLWVLENRLERLREAGF